MKTSMEHLSEDKQADLRRIVGLILQEFGDEVGMIVLFGSFARGDWVEERAPDSERYQYRSDYDLMAITRNKAHRHVQRWGRVEDAVRKAIGPSPTLERERIDFFNRMLSLGYYFYVDIAKEGILLHDARIFTLAEPRILTPEEAKAKAETHYGKWFKSAVGAVEGFGYFLSRDDLNWAAFILHQATERFLAAFLLVHTDYKPKVHDLEKLMALAAASDVKMLRVFPKGTKEEERLFELLRSAYVDARYNYNFTVTREELDYLAGRVELLRGLVESSCQERIAGLAVTQT